jgi:hypothetical protein
VLNWLLSLLSLDDIQSELNQMIHQVIDDSCLYLIADISKRRFELLHLLDIDNNQQVNNDNRLHLVDCLCGHFANANYR